MVLSLEQEQRLKKEKKRKIMSLRMVPETIPELIEKWIAWYSIDYILNRKYHKRKHETRWMTTNPSDGGTQS